MCSVYDSAWIKNSQQTLLDSHIIKIAAFLYTEHSIRRKSRSGPMTVLSADIGGTNFRLGAVKEDGSILHFAFFTRSPTTQ